ncbi:ribonuclease H2, subunit B [Dipodascopsis uninucleata]
MKVLVSHKVNEISGTRTIVQLPHPVTGMSNRYMVTTAPNMIFELTIVGGESLSSIILKPEDGMKGMDGYAISSGEMIVTTPISPVYFLLSTLSRHEQNYRTWEDIEELLLEQSSNYQHILPLLERTIGLVAEEVEPTEGVKCYRLSRAKLFNMLNKKAETMMNKLPSSVERTVIVQKLAPIRFDEPTPEIMYQRARLQLAMDMLLNYLPDVLAKEFKAQKADDFKLLHEFTIELEKSRKIEVMKTMNKMMHTNGSKRAVENEDEFSQKGKKAKKQNNVSSSARRLQKVDTNGMAKLTSFFKKKV